MLTDPPDNDVVEVSVFGPGVGESIAVHLSEGDWIIVDSCRDSLGEIPVLNYLKAIGVDPAASVKLVVGTHAHDDHFAGMADLLAECRSAYFVSSAAAVREEYIALLKLEQFIPSAGRRSAVREYTNIRKVIEGRGRDDAGNEFVKYALENSILFERPQVSVRAISPSSGAITRSRMVLASQFPQAGDEIKPRQVDPNILAVALWVEVRGKALLLGADLLNGPVGCGWGAAVYNFSRSTKASLYKVAHHGSPGAHLPAAWDALLENDPVAILAPYRGGVTARPSANDAARICAISSTAYVTSAPDRVAMSRGDRREAAKLGPLAMNVRRPSGLAGHVRARSRVGQASWKVDTSRPARALREVLA